MDDKARRALRAQVRAARRALAPERRRTADAAIQRAIRMLPAFRRAGRIGAFLAFDGEPSLDPLIAAATRAGKEVCVPIIRGDDIHFARLDRGAPSRLNFFGIVEPERPALVAPRSLDLVLTPLVAFDDAGARLGVGKGYYDRCFAYQTQARQWLRPKLLGVAYSIQRVDDLEPRAWDVPLWGIATEDGARIFSRGG
jgi:5-formyltetrahydrofolate cyclo-ligase